MEKGDGKEGDKIWKENTNVVRGRRGVFNKYFQLLNINFFHHRFSILFLESLVLIRSPTILQ